MMRKIYTSSGEPSFTDWGVFEELKEKHMPIGASGFAPITTLLGNIDGDAGDNVLDGSEDRDIIDGKDGNDTLNGNGGSDDLIGGAGADAMNGGDGQDLASYRTSTTGVTIDMNNAANGTGDAKGDTFSSIEGIEGTDYDDVVHANNAGIIIVGGLGKDSLYGGTGEDSVAYVAGSQGVTVDLDGGTGQYGLADGDTYSSIENVYGTSFDDTITGNASNNKLYGGAGNDYFNGHSGNDLFDGGAGTKDRVDYYDAAAGVVVDLNDAKNNLGEAAGDTLVGIEELDGTKYNDTLIGNGSDNHFDGWEGDDVLIGGAGADQLHGGDGFDTVSYRTASVGVVADLADSTKNTGDALDDSYADIEALEGSAFGDTLRGDINDNTLRGLAGDDTLIGGMGNDVLDGGLGADTLDGGDGDMDVVDYTAADTGVYLDLNDSKNNAGGALGDKLSNIEIVLGSDFADTIVGDVESNILYGGKGSDRLSGGAGKSGDYYQGGDGFDVVTYAASNASVTVDLKDNTKSTGDATKDVFMDIEAVEGSNFDDVLRADTTGGINLYGLDGNDTLTSDVAGDILSGGAGNDKLFGNGGDDALIGGSGADMLDGGSGTDRASYEDATSAITIDLATGVHTGDAKGDTYISIESYTGSAFNDTMKGSTGDDIFDGGKGDDLLSGGAGNDHIEGGEGKDWLEGGDGNDALIGGDGDDTAIGRIGDDTLMGGNGNDSLYGSQGQDNLDGGTGDDMLSGGDDSDVLVGGDGKDTLYGGNGDDAMDGGKDDDLLSGGLGKDLLYGGDNDDKLYGNEGDDTLKGEAGKDLLFGGQGHDTLTGGTEADIFVLRVGDNTTKTMLTGADIITDYKDGEDKIGLADSLTFSDLTFKQNGADVEIYTKGGEALAVVHNVNQNMLEATDFVHVV
jgi:Ca2+-binding RTX toxin-like protein